MFEFRRID